MSINVTNILDELEFVGEEALREDLAAFSCDVNEEIEEFIREKAIDFARRKLSITYIVSDTDDGAILGYFTLTHKSIVLSMDNDFCFRLGYGKPLGLGSVKLSIEWDANGNIPVMTGKALRERYMSLDDTPDAGLSKERAQSIIKKYQEAMADAYGNKNNTQKFKFSDLESELDELMSCYNEKQKAEFKSVWQNALERGDKSAPLDDFPESEIIRELLESEPELKNKLDDLYNSDKKTFQDFAKYDFGWSDIDFIKDFIAAMKGFDEPVAYPRNSYNSGKKGEKSAKDEKGFEWFVENERGRPLPGYSLPLIGTPLKGFEIKNK